MRYFACHANFNRMPLVALLKKNKRCRKLVILRYDVPGYAGKGAGSKPACDLSQKSNFFSFTGCLLPFFKMKDAVGK